MLSLKVHLDCSWMWSLELHREFSEDGSEQINKLFSLEGFIWRWLSPSARPPSGTLTAYMPSKGQSLLSSDIAMKHIINWWHKRLIKGIIGLTREGKVFGGICFEVILRTGVGHLFGSTSVLKFYYIIRSFIYSKTNETTFTVNQKNTELFAIKWLNGSHTTRKWSAPHIELYRRHRWKHLSSHFRYLYKGRVGRHPRHSSHYRQWMKCFVGWSHTYGCRPTISNVGVL